MISILALVALFLGISALTTGIALAIRHFAKPTDLDIARGKRRKARADIRRAVERSARGRK